MHPVTEWVDHLRMIQAKVDQYMPTNHAPSLDAFAHQPVLQRVPTPSFQNDLCMYCQYMHIGIVPPNLFQANVVFGAFNDAINKPTIFLRLLALAHDVAEDFNPALHGMPPQKFVALPMIQAFATAAALQKLGHELEQRLNWTTDANGVPVAAPFLAINPPANEQMTVGQYLSSLL